MGDEGALGADRVIAVANKAAGRTVVRALRTLPSGTADVAPAGSSAAALTGPAKTRETACEGYRRALAAE
ncbi:hypothetical protein [Streptomyces sp. MMS24-I29]|uniref:hypothetical protein n=1 Tax=Streptomyces sp. MMS24-I29 TaxID=3351480 RepID=UPI003C7B5370